MSTTTAEPVYFIHVRGPGEKRARLLTPRGGLTRLRVHAAQVVGEEKARAACEQMARDNPGHTFTARPAYRAPKVRP